MEIIRINSMLDIKDYGPLAIAHGYFDGVHRAHQVLLNQCVEYAKSNQMRSAVITFTSKPKTNVYVLSSFKRKCELFVHFGIDLVIVIDFDEFCNLSANDYIEKVVYNLGTKHFVLGCDNHFGKDRLGDFKMLQNNYHSIISTQCINMYMHNDEKISSSRIRLKLQNGDICSANNLLGYYYKLNGLVVHGNKIGRTIGYPTANLKITDNISLPKIGIYASVVKVNNKLYKAMSYIGYRPVIHQNNPKIVVETHLFDFDEDIYDEYVDVYFIYFIRDEEKFDSLDELKIRLIDDKTKVLDALNIIDDKMLF